MRRKTILAGAAIAALATLTGCNGSANTKDVTGVRPVVNPGNITSFANIDQQPNFSRVCADGLAFITTSRDTMPINRLPEWDWACPKPPGFVQYKGPATNLLGGPTRVIQSSDGG